jgi:uncharacterized repeat protein (TIGR01451 family)
VTARRYTLCAVALALGAGLLVGPALPSPAGPDSPAVIAQIGGPVPPPAVQTHALDAGATPLPPIATSLAHPAPAPLAAPPPSPIVRVAGEVAPFPIPDDGLGRLARPPAPPAPAPLPAAEEQLVEPKPPPDPTPTQPAASPLVQPGSSPSAESPTPTMTPAGAQTVTLALEKVGPATVSIGKPFTYEIVVRNTGTSTAFQVRVEDQTPSNARLLGSEPQAEVQGSQLSWNLGSLDPAGERRIRVEVQPNGEGEIQSSARATCSTTATLRTQVTRPRLTLAKKGPDTALVGDSVAFDLIVSNTGSAPASNIMLRDKLPPGLQHPSGNYIEADLGTLGPGDNKHVTVKVTAVKAGRFVNEASVSAADVPEVTAQAAVVVSEAVLTLRKTGPQETNPEQELEYRLELTNTGSAPATGVTITDLLPEGLEFISASDGGTLDAAAHKVQWPMGTVANGQSRAVTVRARAVSPGDWSNKAVVRTERGQETTAELPVHVEGIPAITLEVVDLDDPIEVGAETTYEIRVVNQGSSSCVNLKIQAVVPDGMTVQGADGPAEHQIQGQQVTFDPLPKLAAKADTVYKVRVRGVKPGDWHFRAYVSSDHMQRPVYEDESTTVYQD